jgi:hypothetical protein
MVQVARVCRALDGAGAQEEECFKDGVVQDMEHRGDEGDAAPEPLALSIEQEPAAKAHRDDADVLDGVEGKQLLQLLLEEGVQDAADCRQNTQGEKSLPPNDGVDPRGEDHADQPI